MLTTMIQFAHLTPPTEGAAITRKNGELVVPDHPVVPFIEGDGTGPDIWRASVRVFDAAVERAYGSRRKIVWFEVPAGEKAKDQYNEWLPNDTIEAVKAYKIAIKGPLTTPVGGGIRSLNVTLRQVLDLYACVRPVRYFDGMPAPVKHPELMDVVIFRENTEDVYAGIEWAKGTPQAERVIEFLSKEMGKRIRPDSGIGIKPMSEFGSKRLVRKAILYAIATKRKTVTLVHKGNIMKFTEGAFRDWGYEVAKAEFRDQIVTEEEVVGRREPRGQDPHQRSHRRQRVPADSHAHGRLRGVRHAESQRRLSLRRVRGAGRRPRHGARREHQRRHRVLRSHARHGAEVRGQGRDQPEQRHPLGPDDARLHGLERSGRPDHARAREDHRAEAGDLRPGASDGRRDRAEDVASSPTPSSRTCSVHPGPASRAGSNYDSRESEES